MSAERFSKLYFIISAAFLCAFGGCFYGFSIGYFRIWPYEQSKNIINNIQSFILTKGKWAAPGLYVSAPEKSSRIRVIVHRQENFMPGYRRIMGWDIETEH